MLQNDVTTQQRASAVYYVHSGIFNNVICSVINNVICSVINNVVKIIINVVYKCH